MSLAGPLEAFPLVLLIKVSPGDKWCPTIDYARYGRCTVVDMPTGVLSHC